ncbi:hypothetical protein TNCV_1651101 [Trichonephila clavipes]|nr:hypothetical protein TNCV_1651101 [Trichonephila clavipes]
MVLKRVSQAEFWQMVLLYGERKVRQAAWLNRQCFHLSLHPSYQTNLTIGSSFLERSCVASRDRSRKSAKTDLFSARMHGKCYGLSRQLLGDQSEVMKKEIEWRLVRCRLHLETCFVNGRKNLFIAVLGRL